MENSRGSSGRKRRSASRGQLRRHANIDGVIVEGVFNLSRPTGDNTSSPQVLATGSNSIGTDEGEVVGDGCYVSTTVHNRRYYGVLVDQAALKAASYLYFQDEASSLDLNRRMMILDQQRKAQTQSGQEMIDGTLQPVGIPGSSTVNKRSAESALDNCEKRTKNSEANQPESRSSLQGNDVVLSDNTRPIQKFEYISEKAGPGYRNLLATYANISAASEADNEKARLIDLACQSGGDFVGDYYYQFEVLDSALNVSTASMAQDKRKYERLGFRTSMGIHSFFHNTFFPPWYPLSNLACDQTKILSMLQMKKNNKGGIDWDSNAILAADGKQPSIPIPATLPMAPRSAFRVGIIGGGIAGVACAAELLRLARSDEEKLNIEVVLLEARPRLGGRLKTDYQTFKSPDGEGSIPVDLGGAWIHGINQNPLTVLAREAGINLITASEEVKMLGVDRKEVDAKSDRRMGKLFDDLLDHAAKDCWVKNEFGTVSRNQTAVRWYADILDNMNRDDENGRGDTSLHTTPKKHPLATDAQPHRHSSDVSVDHAIGDAMKEKRGEVKSLHIQEQHLLHWNAKNTEYALGANIRDLSMKYWDTDENHAFEGDHVLLKQGYSRIIEHLLEKCNQHGDKFKVFLEFPVGKIEYALKSTSLQYPDANGRNRKTINLSDTCRVSSRDGRVHNFDFVVCALPLGILKDSVHTAASPKTVFEPMLPQSKVDAIKHVGFGLLNKVCLQFPTAFWRKQGSRESLRDTPFLADGQSQFGNASGFNPHHYMFFDLGRILCEADASEPPAILLTLISGSEAVKSEQIPEAELVKNVVSTLKYLFGSEQVPDPTAAKTTRWGSDEFSRGSYTFLPPGATDEDYHILQSPVNGNGCALVSGDSETMRLFFAGEHTTALHPSMAHGALLSGIRAAQEVISNIDPKTQVDESTIDRPIPICIYREKHPKAILECHMCHLQGSQKREGALLAFKRGSRHALVHSNCAQYSPEVGLKNGTWTDVIKSVNRGRQIQCTLCNLNGGTIGCSHPLCSFTFHFGCCEETGWQFERDGKAFRCDLHRTAVSGPAEGGNKEEDRISIRFFRYRDPLAPVMCTLCRKGVDDDSKGELLGFQRNSRRILVHDKCVRYASFMKTVVEADRDDDDEEEELFVNIFEAASWSRQCFGCNLHGALIECSDAGCSSTFHFSCAEETGWLFDKQGRRFRCKKHRDSSFLRRDTQGSAPLPPVVQLEKAPAFRHDLFCTVGDRNTGSQPKVRSARTHTPSNDYIGYETPTFSSEDGQSESEESGGEGVSKWSSGKKSEQEKSEQEDVMVRCLATYPHLSNPKVAESSTLHEVVRARRANISDPWNIAFCVEKGDRMHRSFLRVLASGDGEQSSALAHGMQDGAIVISLNEIKVGSEALPNLGSVLDLMRRSVDLRFEILRHQA